MAKIYASLFVAVFAMSIYAVLVNGYTFNFVGAINTVSNILETVRPVFDFFFA